MAPAQAFDCVAACLALVCLWLVHFAADAVHLRLDRHAHGGRAELDQLGLDFRGGLKVDDFGPFAAAAHLLGFEGG